MVMHHASCTDAACRVSPRVVMHLFKNIETREETRQAASVQARLVRKEDLHPNICLLA
jgi:hypothetical protein